MHGLHLTMPYPKTVASSSLHRTMFPFSKWYTGAPTLDRPPHPFFVALQMPNTHPFYVRV